MPKARINRTDYQDYEKVLLENDNLKFTLFFGSEKLGERHLNEFRMWMNGGTYTSISTRFGISIGQVRYDILKATRIIAFYQKSAEERLAIVNNLHPVTPYMRLLEYFQQIANENNLSKSNAVRAANAFARSMKDCDDYLLELQKSDLGSFVGNIFNCGFKSDKIIYLAQKKLQKE